MDLNKITKDIIKNNIYLTLATSEGEEPWAAVLYYCVDDKYNFYFISNKNTLHVQQLLKNPHVATTIFDSHQPEGSGNGVQMKGTCYEVKNKELPETLKFYKTTFMECSIEAFSGSSPYRMYKIIPGHIYVLDPKVDRRIEVQLK